MSRIFNLRESRSIFLLLKGYDVEHFEHSAKKRRGVGASCLVLLQYLHPNNLLPINIQTRKSVIPSVGWSLTIEWSKESPGGIRFALWWNINTSNTNSFISLKGGFYLTKKYCIHLFLNTLNKSKIKWS